MSESVVGAELPAGNAGAQPSPEPDVSGEGGSGLPDVGSGAAGTPPGEPQHQDVGGSSGGEAPPSTEGEDWKDRRLAKVTAQKRELEARLRALAGGQETPAPVEGEARYTQADLDREANARAERLADTRAFSRQCDDVRSAGVKQFPDFAKRIDALSSVADHSNPREAQAYLTMLQASIATGAAAQVLHHLGGTPDEAERLMNLTPVQQAVEITKLAEKLQAPKVAASAAPRPPSASVTGSGGSPSAIDPADARNADKLSSADWFKKRNEQVAAQRAASRAPRRA
jgi:hypothetical protein